MIHHRLSDVSRCGSYPPLWCVSGGFVGNFPLSAGQHFVRVLRWLLDSTSFGHDYNHRWSGFVVLLPTPKSVVMAVFMLLAQGNLPSTAASPPGRTRSGYWDRFLSIRGPDYAWLGRP